MNAKRLVIALLFCGYLFSWGGNSSDAATLHIPGFVEVNQYSLPAGVPERLGDVMFSADGNTLYILGGSESEASGVWSVPVLRNLSGTVTGLGAPTFFFSKRYMDTSLEFKPGSETLFVRLEDGIGERRPDGTIVTFSAEEAALAGSLAFVPDPLPNAGDLLVGNWDTGVIYSHSLKDNFDDTFTPMFQGFYSNSQYGATGDLHFIPSGIFANDLMFTNWYAGTISIIAIDPLTGTPAPTSDSPKITLFASELGQGPWGLEFDPITGDLFISNYDGDPDNAITQISGFPPPDNLGPVTTAVTADPNPVAIGRNVVLTANVDDTNTGGSRILSAEYRRDDRSTWSPMNATQAPFDSVNEGVAASFDAPNEAGIYNFCVRGTDVRDNEGTPECVILVVYDPDGGFVTGGGWIDSPPGAYMADPALTGQAEFGFVSKYTKGTTVPNGNTEFRFHAGDLNFYSSSYDFLVVTMGDTAAQFKGFGTINGELAPNGMEYKFMIWAQDDDLDTFRVKIWYDGAGDTEEVVYDNGFDQEIGGGSILIHINKK